MCFYEGRCIDSNKLFSLILGSLSFVVATEDSKGEIIWGDGISCNEGYESDGSGGCIPFGTGDYGFDEPVQEQLPVDEPAPEPTPEPTNR
jgi:hypothetical protein|tara:strand:- start:624 stop:893 length:270 start_codon:yes stop_codon:yes gene_type:complete